MFADILLVFADLRRDSVESKENLPLLTSRGRIWGDSMNFLLMDPHGFSANGLKLSTERGGTYPPLE